MGRIALNQLENRDSIQRGLWDEGTDSHVLRQLRAVRAALGTVVVVAPGPESVQCWHSVPEQVAIAQAEADVKPSGGRVLLRYSGTEPKARLLVEGRDSAVLEKWTKRIADAIKKQVGV